MFRHTISCLAVAAALLTTACVEEPVARDFGFSPRSLDGTEVDGAFHYDRDGAFVFDEDAQRAFDYFLTTEGELSWTEMQGWVEAVIVTEVSPSQRDAVLSSWHAYVAYRAEAAAALEAEGEAAMMATGGPAGDAANAVAGREALLAMLEAEFEGTPFYEAERARVERAFALRAVYTELGHDRVARDAELARIDAAEAERFAQTRAGRFLAAREQIEAARASGASDAQVQALRVEHFDALAPGAAERLAALDAKREAWTARVDAFDSEAEALRARLGGDPAELDAALAQLSEASFSPAEQRRLTARSR